MVVHLIDQSASVRMGMLLLITYSYEYVSSNRYKSKLYYIAFDVLRAIMSVFRIEHGHWPKFTETKKKQTLVRCIGEQFVMESEEFKPIYVVTT